MDLRTYLFEQRISQKAFGELLGLSRSAIASYVGKRRNPKYYIAVKIERLTKGKVKAIDLISEGYKAELEGGWVKEVEDVNESIGINMSVTL